MKTPEEIAELDKRVKKTIGRAKAGKGIALIMEEGSFKGRELRHVQRSLIRLLAQGEIVREGSKRYSRYVVV